MGGLDVQSDPTECAAGTLRDCLNFEVNQSAGYSRRLGYVPYDGTIVGQEQLEFLYLFFGFTTYTGGVPIYGEQMTLTVGSGINVILIGTDAAAGNVSYIIFAYNNTTTANFVDWPNIVPSAVSGAISGFSITGLTTNVSLTSVYSGTSGTNFGPNLNVSDYALYLLNIGSMEVAAAKPIPGNPLSPPDSTFLLNDTTYSTHDCIVFNFNSGTNASIDLLEGHVIKAVGGATTYGTVLNYIVTSGDWVSGTAAGFVVVYDVPLGTSFPANNTQMNVYTADGITAIGNIFNYTSAGSLAAKPSNSRALIYKTSDQTAGYTSAFTGWSRVPLTREIQYTQAYAGQTTGIGFGPTGGSPFSIYEYSRQGLTNILTQLTPLSSVFWGCTAPTQFGGTGWVNITNVEVSDGVFTTQAITHNATGNRPGKAILASTYAFTDVPTGSAILGITVELIWKTTTGTTTIKDGVVSLQVPSSPVTYTPPSPGKVKNVFGTTVNTTYLYGGPNDLWGHGWKLSELQSPTFAVFANFTNGSTTTNDTVNLDFIGVQVTYLPPSRIVYIRNALASSPTDVPAFIVHYTLDNNTQFTSNNGVGTLTIYSTGTEASFTAAGKTRVVGAGEQIRDAPAGAGNLLGWTASTDTPSSLPCGSALDTNGSRWEWNCYNFYSDPTAQVAVGANGVEYGVGFDGTYLIRVRTGRRVDLDNPRHVFGYANNVHWGYNSGDVNISAPGRPFTVAGLQLSQAYNIGQPVVGFRSLQGQVLAVFGPRAVFGLQGTDPTNYTQITLSPALGAFEYTVGDVEGSAVWTSFRGVETMSTTNAYGEFDTIPLSQLSTPWLQPRLQSDTRIAIVNKRPLYATTIRNKRQYRVYFADGYYYTLTKYGPSGIPMGTIGKYSSPQGFGNQTMVPRHLFQGVRNDGKEVNYACFDFVTPFGASPEYYPYAVRLEVGYMDCGFFYPNNFELNPVYPYQQNNNVTPVHDFQYQTLVIFMASLGGNGVAYGNLSIYTIAGDDIPVSQGNYSTLPTTAAPFQMAPSPTVTLLYTPLPVIPTTASITAYGRMIKVRVEDLNNGGFLGGPMTATKIQVIYSEAAEQGNY